MDIPERRPDRLLLQAGLGALLAAVVVFGMLESKRQPTGEDLSPHMPVPATGTVSTRVEPVPQSKALTQQLDALRAANDDIRAGLDGMRVRLKLINARLDAQEEQLKQQRDALSALERRMVDLEGAGKASTPQ